MRAAAWTLLTGSMIFLAWSILASPGCDRAEPRAESEWDEIERRMPGTGLSESVVRSLRDLRDDTRWTVKDELMRLGASVQDGRLVSRSGKEIKFYHLHIPRMGSVWNVYRAEQGVIARLQEEYDVVVVSPGRPRYQK